MSMSRAINRPERFCMHMAAPAGPEPHKLRSMICCEVFALNENPGLVAVPDCTQLTPIQTSLDAPPMPTSYLTQPRLPASTSTSSASAYCCPDCECIIAVPADAAGSVKPYKVIYSTLQPNCPPATFGSH